MDHSRSGRPEGILQGQVLLSLARGSIGEMLGVLKTFPEEPSWLTEPRASFVTLTQKNALRGCVGSLSPLRSLGEDVRYNAQMAAFKDPRFPPLSLSEFSSVKVGVSVLSPLEPLYFTDLNDLAEKIVPGDGLLIRWGSRSSTYLPEVWEMLPDRKEFLSELLRKGGISPKASPEELRAYRYNSTVWKET